LSIDKFLGYAATEHEVDKLALDGR
jgi:hypothetical protein